MTVREQARGLAPRGGLIVSCSREIMREDITRNAKGRHSWIAFPDPVLENIPRGIERVRLSRLAALLGPRKVAAARFILDPDAGTLAASWTRHDGRKGRLVFRMQRIPKRERPHGALQRFEWWCDKESGEGNSADKGGLVRRTLGKAARREAVHG